MQKNKKYIFIIILILVLSIVGVSYAVWQLTLTQTNVNTLSSACFKIELKEENDITLTNAYPITDEEGSSLKPYTFTITNVCDTYATYQVNLEVLKETTFTKLDTIKIKLNEKEGKILNSYEEVEKTLDNAVSSKKIENGYLSPKEEKIFTLRLWMDYDTPPNEEYMNKNFTSKITIITSYLNSSPSYAEAITNCSKNGYQTAKCMLENSKYAEENLVYDETIDNNLRYIGANPNNYVSFNNELWRIIGVMNNIDDGTGKKETRIKLIRNESIGSYSWDSSASNINSGWGVNEWSQADIMKLLNSGYESESIGGSLYWNHNSGRCYNGENNANKECDFSSTGMRDDFKNMIDSVIWNISGNKKDQTYDNINVPSFYQLERGNNIEKSNDIYGNDTITRTSNWVGKVGLMYLSDYGYATSGGKDCLNSNLITWHDLKKCYENNYLYKGTTNWSITRLTYTYYSVFCLNKGNCTESNRGDLAYEVFPTLYLKQNVSITSGNGTTEQPFALSIA